LMSASNQTKERTELVVVRRFLIDGFRNIDGRGMEFNFSWVSIDHTLINMVIKVVTIEMWKIHMLINFIAMTVLTKFIVIRGNNEVNNFRTVFSPLGFISELMV
jgi:hypothetical protein